MVGAPEEGMTLEVKGLYGKRCPNSGAEEKREDSVMDASFPSRNLMSSRVMVFDNQGVL